jgi:hypothetical protein
VKRSDPKLDILKENIFPSNHKRFLDHTIFISPVKSEQIFIFFGLVIMNNMDVPPFVRGSLLLYTGQ